ncbi:MAG: radical SAM protein [Desulfosudaceae bacterium]
MGKKYKYLFGPVPSRRFGWSLGIDLLPFKTCSLDCLFCQLGRTTDKTITRKDFVPVAEVRAELDDWLAAGGQADYLTLSGSGEPTLHSEFGKVLQHLENQAIPSVLLTNGTLLNDPAVRQEAGRAKVVKVSLSAWDQSSFQRVNRPNPELTFERLLEGQKQFRDQFEGKLWMEVFLMPGINARPDEVEQIAAHVNSIGPDRVHLNTVVRPPAEDYAAPLSRERLTALTRMFKPEAEIIADLGPSATQDVKADTDSILAMLRRRPCTMAQLGKSFGLHPNEISKYLGQLSRDQKIISTSEGTDVYYSAVTGENNES